MVSNHLVPIVKPLSRININSKAAAFMKTNFPDAMLRPEKIDLFRFLDGGGLRKYGFEFGVEEMPTNMEGYVDFIHKLLMLSTEIYYSLEKGIPRSRFTAAHEIGHVMLHNRQISDRVADYGIVQKAYRKSIPNFKNPEWQADEYAASILMPVNHCVNAYNEDNLNPSWFVENFGVSYQAAKIRCENINREMEDPRKKAQIFEILGSQDLF
ncbi:ImmA/IrrE family metallo-endopeptidase (plasmid) [Leptospira interrogans serovar Canicola]|uniref:ImmA/IrrE family metallo-endopeptidase n=3 Tax=Leptospira interrogans TaxID=173 RepID=A0AAQ0B1H8_LEPIR|nr:ImmA/IrrE family metallo-endopeptidase [Leptospira interrogans serovar Canicola]QOI53101.1 ImmA/IrrE family metallo-endopeptidase [Leptospira interrogans serovar Bataviae]